MEKLKNAKKITLATVKSFIKRNREKLYINVKSKFDGMTDGIEKMDFSFLITSCKDSTLGINGIWFVGNSRDYFENYENDKFIGIRVDNCCGSFIVAIEK